MGLINKLVNEAVDCDDNSNNRGPFLYLGLE